MSIRVANNLEREGKIQESILENLNLLEREYSSTLTKIVEGNIFRLLKKMEPGDITKIQNRFDLIKRTANLKKEGNNFLAKEQPLVSVVVPCYNVEDLLRYTVESLINQTYGNFEVILVDDFSKDRTATLCKDVAHDDKRFRFYQHRSNGGLAASRNSGIRLAKGEYICFLDSDDLLAKESLAQRVEKILKYDIFESIAGVYDMSITVPHDFNGITESTETKPLKHYVDFISSFGDCPFNANQPLLKRDVVISMGGFPEKYPQAEDWRLWSKILRSGYSFLPVHRVGSFYRQTTNSMIRRAPLLHVEKSHGNYFRAFKSSTAEQDPCELRYEDIFYSKALFTESVGVYFGKTKFIPRVFNFIGIEYARVEASGEALDSREIANYILRIEPEFKEIFSEFSIENAFNWVMNGYKRFYGIEIVQEQKANQLKMFTTRAIGAIRPLWETINLMETPITIPERKIPRKKMEFFDLLFVPHKYYHTHSFSLLLDEIFSRGLTYKFMDISVPYRDEGAKIQTLESDFLSYNEFVFSRLTPRAIICMNDWDTVVKPLVRKANAECIPTIGIVEGVQDYFDVDTGRTRNPYSEVSSVFLPGDFDRKYFHGESQQLFSTGIQRLEGLQNYQEARSQIMKSTHSRSLVVLNVNFSYGVMTDCRNQWVADVSEACKEAGLELVISQHPQDDGDLSAYTVSEEPLYDLLTRARFFISRFSGAILEALVIGCPVIYFNGNGEKVDKFIDSQGAYDITNNKSELVEFLKKSPVVNRSAVAFLQAHSCYGLGSIIERTSNAIEAIVRGSPRDIERYARFKKSLFS